MVFLLHIRYMHIAFDGKSTYFQFMTLFFKYLVSFDTTSEVTSLNAHQLSTFLAKTQNVWPFLSEMSSNNFLIINKQEKN